MTPADLVSEARRHGAEFSVNSEGNVMIRNQNRIPANLRAQMDEHRDAIRRYLRLMRTEGSVKQGNLFP